MVGTVGPTIGAEYAIDWYVAPLINKYLSQPTITPRGLQVKLLEDIPAPMPFDFYARLQIQKFNGAYAAKPAGNRFSPLARMLQANAYLRIPGEVDGYKAGVTVEAELRWPLEWI
ncbi:hypothetical protein [Desulfotruncus arcticus]|uniref:hypothetical protein n=1 Tax=Desulfotruncus arcticus TaxID=341036 RepID=UPI00307E5BF7